MTDAQGALLSAGVLLVAVGVFLAGLPGGLLYGGALAVVGGVVAAVVVVRGQAGWRRAAAEYLSRPESERDPSRRSLDDWLGGLAASTATLAVLGLVSRLWRDGAVETGAIVFYGGMLLVSAVCTLVLIRRRVLRARRRR